MYNSPNALWKGIKATFAKMLEGEFESTFKSLIDRMKTSTKNEEFRVPETMPRFKEWIDKRHFGDYSDLTFQVTVKDWDNGVSVDRNTLDDSKQILGGQIEQEVKGIADGYQEFPDEVAQLILTNNTNAFDGTALFANTRPNIDTGSNTIDNLITGTSSSTYSLAEFEADFISAKQQLLGLLDKNDNAFNKKAKLAVLVPQHMEDVVLKLLDARSDRIYDGTAEKSNLYAGGAEIMINWEQTDTTDNDWYMVNTAAKYKPFLILDRQAPKWTDFDDGKKKFIEYGVDFRMGYAALSPFGIVKVNN